MNTVWVKDEGGNVAEVSVDSARHLIQVGKAKQVAKPKNAKTIAGVNKAVMDKAAKEAEKAAKNEGSTSADS